MINYVSDFRYVDPFRIFAIKVESCQKSRKILDDFLALLNVWGRAFHKLYQVYHSCLAARRLKKFHEDTPTSPEVIEPNTLNFRPNFKFSRLKLGGGTLDPFGGVRRQALVSL